MASEPSTQSRPTGSTALWNRSTISRARTVLERLRNALLYSSTYLALVAAAEVALVMIVLSLPVNLSPLVVGLVTFAVYVNDRLADLETDEAVAPNRTAFVRRHQRVLYVAGAIAYGVAVALAVSGGPLAFGLTLLPGAFWVLYALDYFAALGSRIRRLKEVLIVNSAVVALAWSVTIVGMPVAFTNAPITPTAGVLFGYLFLATFVNTEIPNVPDVESDAAAGVSTLPVVVGVRRTRQSLYGVVLLTLGLIAYAVLRGLLVPAAALALLAGLVCLVTTIAFLGRSDAERRLAISAELSRVPALGVLVLVTVGL
ncbi:UbiA family prenyltransferase [Halopenitus sp. POP-27]|uniref:UbiA family prenyltransferase n=1 Tax=Halopenitus sp. POP-27 TaxID=2994425 RepID=UPI002468C847|nr:UbiA family prenyltransferase [Halopenitus sp. POP-27]